MAFGALHVTLGLELNSTLPALGHLDHPGLWQDMISQRPFPPGILECLGRTCNCLRWMYPRQYGPHRQFVHFSADQLRQHVGESDEHKAWKEYIHTRATQEGLTAEVEVTKTSNAGKRRIDVNVVGAVSLACEVQESRIAASTVHRRAELDTGNGDVSCFIADDPYSQAINRAPWVRVPQNPAWRIHAGGGDGILGGLHGLQYDRCGRLGIRCPETGGKTCGKMHARTEPLPGVSLGDMVNGAATERFKPIAKKVGNVVHHLWLPAADWERWNSEIADPEPTAVVRPIAPAVVEPQDLDYTCRHGEDTGVRAARAAPRDVGGLANLGATQTALRCHTCGQKLDPVHAGVGTHPICDPGAIMARRIW